MFNVPDNKHFTQLLNRKWWHRLPTTPLVTRRSCLMRTNLFVWALITNCLFLHVQSNVPEYALAIEENYEIFNLVFPFTYTLHMKCLISQKYFFLLIHMKYINTTVKLLLFSRCQWTQIYLRLFTVIVKEVATTPKVFITCNRQDVNVTNVIEITLKLLH